MAVLGVGFAGEIIASGQLPALAAGTLGVAGLAGVTDWILGDEEEEVREESATDGGDPIFDDAQPAGGGGAAGDEFAFDDGSLEDDGSFGDDAAFDELDSDDGAGGSSSGGAAVERRVDELEEELDAISSTVSTVRSENEQISESVEEVEENVRKLLDIYKLVTKGVNPFVDQEGGESFSGNEASLGLFEGDDDEEPPEEDADLDDEVADADPDEFFDDDFEEDDPDAGADEEDADEDGSDEGADADEVDTESASKSFDDLREEYESHPEWSPEADESEDDEPADVRDEDGGDDPADTAPSESAFPGLSAMDDRTDRVDEPMDQTVASALAAGPEVERERARSKPRTASRGRAPAGREKPYLHEVPGGYVADLIVMEWVEFLVTVGGSEGAHRAITYYENVEWIVPAAADQLREFVEGHPEATVEPEDDGGDPLSMDHHTRSLRYIARLNGDVQENVLDAWDEGDNRWLHR